MTESNDSTPAPTRLEVSGREFVQEIKRMSRVLGRRKAGDALLRHHAGELHVRIGGAECSLPAQGHWVGEACVAGAWLIAIAKVPPAEASFVFQVQAGRLRLGKMSTPCRFLAPGAARLGIPLDPDLPSLIALGHRHDDAELEKAGLLSLVVDARHDLDRRITRAAKALSPLGVTASDLHLLVAGKLANSGR